MRRGEVWLADLEPSRGSEANKRRPVVIVSNDGANTTAERLGHGVVTVVPVTSNVQRIYPFQVLLPADETTLDHDCKAQAEQVRSIDVQRLRGPVATVPTHLMHELDDALRLHLQLWGA